MRSSWDTSFSVAADSLRFATAAAHGYFARLVVWTDNSPDQIAAWARRRGVAGASVEHFLVSEHVAHVLRLAGLSLNTGTINELDIARRVIALAAPDAICTDRPLELRAELEAAVRSADHDLRGDDRLLLRRALPLP